MLLLAPMTKAAVLSFNATSDIVSKETVCGPRKNVKCRQGLRSLEDKFNISGINLLECFYPE